MFVAGGSEPLAAAPSLSPDYATRAAENVSIGFATSPAEPVAGAPTQLRFTIDPSEGLERYLGVWAHMLAASDDLIDMMHVHPSLADGGREMQFNNVVFPRARGYRIWIQVLRHGVVSTAHFDVVARRGQA